MTITSEQLEAAIDAIEVDQVPCEDLSCDTCKLHKIVLESPTILNWMIQSFIDPKKMEMLCVRMIELGAALKEKEILEEMAKK